MDNQYLEIRDDDKPHIIALKTRWQYLMSLTKEQRQYELQLDKIREEERHLNWMIETNKDSDNLILECTNRARQAIANYELYDDKDSLDSADSWTQVAQGLKGTRFTIADIRKQRERVQWERKKLNQMTKPK